MRIPFNKPFMVGKELLYVTEAHSDGHLSGDGRFFNDLVLLINFFWKSNIW